MSPSERRHQLKLALKGCHILKGNEKHHTHECSEEDTKKNYGVEYRSCAKKMRYKTLGDATMMIGTLKTKGRGDYFRAYHCEICNGYHITHHRKYHDKS